MTDSDSTQRLLQLFADILDYPRSGPPGGPVRECESVAAPLSAEATALLREFRAFAESVNLGRLEEVYSSTFDLDPSCYPYVGYHLLGESYKRSAFLQEIRSHYRAEGFVEGTELPDHIAVMLRFAAVTRDTDTAKEIVSHALLPALERMTGRAKSAGFDDEATPTVPAQGRRGGPYRGVLEALRLCLQALAEQDGQRHTSEEVPQTAGPAALVDGPSMNTTDTRRR